MKLLLNRTFRNQNKTLGDLELWDKQLLLRLRTIELPWLDNEVGKSCIPAGIYQARIHQSPKFGWSLWIHDVPDRTQILVHAANFVRQLKGCIAPGLFHRDIDNDGIIDVTNSRDAMKVLEAYLGALDWIEIEVKAYESENYVEKEVKVPNALKHLIK